MIRHACLRLENPVAERFARGDFQDSRQEFDGVSGRHLGGLVRRELDHSQDAVDVCAHRRLAEEDHAEEISRAVAMVLHLESAVSGEHEERGEDGDDGGAKVHFFWFFI